MRKIDELNSILDEISKVPHYSSYEATKFKVDKLSNGFMSYIKTDDTGEWVEIQKKVFKSKEDAITAVKRYIDKRMRDLS